VTVKRPAPPPRSERTYRNYTVTLRGADGTAFPGATVVAWCQEDAIRQTRKLCKRFELPGWTLCCEGINLPLLKQEERDHSRP